MLGVYTLPPFNDFDIWFWNCSNSVVLFCFSLYIIQILFFKNTHIRPTDWVNRVCNVSHGMSTLSNACYTMGKELLFNLNRTSCQLYHGVNRFLFYIGEVRSIPDQHGEHNFYSDSCRHVNLIGRHYHDTCNVIFWFCSLFLNLFLDFFAGGLLSEIKTIILRICGKHWRIVTSTYKMLRKELMEVY